MRARYSQSGFTLIEILVVVVVIATIVSIGILSLGLLGDDRQLRREAARIGSLLEVAQDEAIMQGREFGLEVMRESYRFVEYDPLQRLWADVPAEDIFRARQLPENIEFDLYIEDKSILLELDAADLSEPEDERDNDARKEYAPHIYIFSSGDTTPFQLRLVDARQEYTVILTADVTGKVEVLTESETQDALLR